MIVHANGIDIFYKKCGEGKPFLIIHGNGESLSTYEELATALSMEYEVFTLDSRCHGKSTRTKTISYQDMTEDIAAFIAELGLEKPILLGASDGGITGLMLAIQYPDVLSALIACGANTNPSQLKKWALVLIKLSYFFTRDPKTKMMLDEPDIRDADLAKIMIPTLILAGSRDIIAESVTVDIAKAIPKSDVKILKGETHESYLRKYKKVICEIKPWIKKLFF